MGSGKKEESMSSEWDGERKETRSHVLGSGWEAARERKKNARRASKNGQERLQYRLRDAPRAHCFEDRERQASRIRVLEGSETRNVCFCLQKYTILGAVTSPGGTPGKLQVGSKSAPGDAPGSLACVSRVYCLMFREPLVFRGA